MGNLLNELITTIVGLGLLGGGYILWLITGIVNCMFNTHTWSWKKTATDLAKAFLMAVVVLGLVALSNGMDWYCGLLGFDISSFTNGMSTVVMLGAITAGIANYYGKAAKNALNFYKLKNQAKIVGEQNYEEVAKQSLEVVNNIVTALYTPKEAVEAHNEFEKAGGLGALYVVDITSYDAFRNTVISKGYDVDGAFGFQCWDGTALLWQQLGKLLLTGEDNARGCWTRCRIENAGTQFNLITDKTKIRRGMVLVFGSGPYGHIGFADEDYAGRDYIRLLGQNQGGTPVGRNGGAGFNVINMSLASFLGAFEYKGWGKTVSSTSDKKMNNSDISTPVKPAVFGHSSDKTVLTIKKGDYVKVIKHVDVNGTNLLNLQNKYLVYQTRKSDQTAVLKTDDGDIYARMSFNNIEKVN